MGVCCNMNILSYFFRFDMYTLEDTIIKARETKMIKTGIAADLEEGYEIQVRPRSGISVKNCKSQTRWIRYCDRKSRYKLV